MPQRRLPRAKPGFGVWAAAKANFLRETRRCSSACVCICWCSRAEGLLLLRPSPGNGHSAPLLSPAGEASSLFSDSIYHCACAHLIGARAANGRTKPERNTGADDGLLASLQAAGGDAPSDHEEVHRGLPEVLRRNDDVRQRFSPVALLSTRRLQAL